MSMSKLALIALAILCISSSTRLASGQDLEPQAEGFDGPDGGYDSYADMMEQMKGMGMGGMPGMGGGGMDPYANYGEGGGYDDGYRGGEGATPEPAMTVLQSVQEAQDWVADSETGLASVIGYFDVVSHSADMQAYEEVASRHKKNFRWAALTDASALEEAKCKGSCVSLHRAARLLSAKHDERAKYRYPSARITATGLEVWAKQKGLPLVGELSTASEALYAGSALPTLVLFSETDRTKDTKGYQYLRTRALKVAQENTGKLLVALARTSEHTKALTVDYGLGDLVFDKTGAVGVGIMSKDRRWSSDPDEAFSVAVLAQFASDYLQGALGEGRAAIRSTKTMTEQEVDELESSGVGPVRVTSETFGEVVHDESKDVLIEFYAPWCGHCKSLAPEYAQVAKFYASKPQVVVAAMDADAHRPPKGYDIPGFPTVMLVPSGNGKPVLYEGEREAADIIEWLEKQRRSHV